ncbi:APC family permease [Enemella sp. A6]|uniref:APC family permease n=1 Tax=Enemella sp. A6 TaxID=3440152 RepID=UPI003EB7C4AB
MTQPTLIRRLGVVDATLLGVGSMLGAGVFAVFAPAAAAAGTGLLIGLALAALVAYCNATSSAQLAAQFPTSGGTYSYGREMLGPWPGFLAGWGFMIGKTASAAAMALTFAAYLVPPAWQRPVGIAAVIVLVGVNYFGITRTAQLTRIIVTAVLAVLVLVVLSNVSAFEALPPVGANGPGGIYGTVQSTGLLFFAFAGYARIATMGEEVRDPQRTIPRAIGLALGIVAVIYAVLGFTLLAVLDLDALATSRAPLVDAVSAGPWAGWLTPIVRVGAALAALGALLALFGGLGRTGLAMARNRDLPAPLAAVHPVHRVPHRAELTVAAVVIVLVALFDLRGVIGFSSFGVLLYYFVANLSAHRQRGEHRRYPRALQVLGAVLCPLLVITLPWQSVLAGVGVFVVGVGFRLIRLRSAA